MYSEGMVDPFADGPSVTDKGDSNHRKRVVCGSCETYVDELITKEDAAGESRTWCTDCWADYDALMGN